MMGVLLRFELAASCCGGWVTPDGRNGLAGVAGLADGEPKDAAGTGVKPPFAAVPVVARFGTAWASAGADPGVVVARAADAPRPAEAELGSAPAAVSTSCCD